MRFNLTQVQGKTRAVLVAGAVANQAAALVKFLHGKGAFGSSGSLHTAASAARDAVSGLLGLAPAEFTSAAHSMATELQAAGVQGVTLGQSYSTALVPLGPANPLPGGAWRTVSIESLLGRFLEIITRGHARMASLVAAPQQAETRLRKPAPMLALPASGHANSGIYDSTRSSWMLLVVMLLMAMALVAVIMYLVRKGSILPVRLALEKSKSARDKNRNNIDAALGRRRKNATDDTTDGAIEAAVRSLVARALASAAMNKEANRHVNGATGRALLQQVADAVNGPADSTETRVGSNAGAALSRQNSDSSWSSDATSSTASSAQTEVLVDSLYDATQHAGSDSSQGKGHSGCRRNGPATYEIVIRKIASMDPASLDRLVAAFTDKVAKSGTLSKREDSKTAPAKRLAALLGATARDMRCQARHVRDARAVEDKIRASLVPAALRIAQSLQMSSVGSQKFVTLTFVNSIDDAPLKAAVMSELEDSINSLGARVANGGAGQAKASSKCDAKRARNVGQLLSQAFRAEANPTGATVSHALQTAISALKDCDAEDVTLDPVHEAASGVFRRMPEPEKRKLLRDLAKLGIHGRVLDSLRQQYENQYSKVTPSNYGSLSNVDLFKAMASAEARSIPTSEYVAYLAALSSTKMLHKNTDMASAAALRADPGLIASRAAAFYAVPKVPVARKRVASALRKICARMSAPRRVQLAAALRKVRPSLASVCS